MKKEIVFTRYVCVGNDGKWDFAGEEFCRESYEKLLSFCLFSDKHGDYICFDGPAKDALAFCQKHGFFIKEVEFSQAVDFGGQSCGRMYQNSDIGKWNNVNCKTNSLEAS